MIFRTSVSVMAFEYRTAPVGPPGAGGLKMLAARGYFRGSKRTSTSVLTLAGCPPFIAGL